MNKTVLALVVVSFLTGCSSKLDCSSADTQKLVGSLINENELLVKGWQLVMAGKGLEAANKIKSERNSEIELLKAERNKIVSAINDEVAVCKKDLVSSNQLKSYLSEIESIKAKISELEKFNPVEPKRFFWGANTTQRQHDEWRSAQDKYEESVSAKRTNLQKLYQEGGELVTKFKSSEAFIVAACDSVANDFRLINHDSINLIEESIMVKVESEFVKFSIDNINQRFANSIAELEKQQQKIDSTVAAIEAESNAAYEKAATAYRDSIASIKYNFSNIVTTSKDEKMNNLTCTADISALIDPETNVNARFTYRLEKTDDKKIYATIVGVR